MKPTFATCLRAAVLLLLAAALTAAFWFIPTPCLP